MAQDLGHMDGLKPQLAQAQKSGGAGVSPLHLQASLHCFTVHFWLCLPPTDIAGMLMHNRGAPVLP